MRPAQDFAPLPLRLGNTVASARDATLRLASHWLAALVRWQRSRRAVAELAALSNRELKDIGMHRSHIYWVASHGRHDPLLGALGRGTLRPQQASVRPRAAGARPQGVKGRGRAA
jgi:uncharacterized protein YjiS (DUF1127 family)